MNPNKLTLTILNRDPVSVHDFANALKGLGAEYNKFIQSHTKGALTDDTKLYVKEIRQGSIIVELMDKLPYVIPFVSDTNTIIEFGKFLKTSFDYFLGKGNKPESGLSVQDCNNIGAIIKPTVNDNGSQLIFNVSDGGTVNVEFNLTSDDSKTIEKNIQKECALLRAPESDNNQKERVILTFVQTKKDIHSTAGTKGVIDSMHSKPLNVIFENEELGRQILHGDLNPLTTAYVVDASTETANQKIVAFKIHALHESFEIPDE